MNIIDAKAIGARIRTLSKKRGLKQQELADGIGVTLNYISKIEPGLKVPSVDVFVTLSDYFDVSIDYIIRGKE